MYYTIQQQQQQQKRRNSNFSRLSCGVVVAVFLCITCECVICLSMTIKEIRGPIKSHSMTTALQLRAIHVSIKITN